MNWFRKRQIYSDEEVIRIILSGSRFENSKMNKHLLEVFFKPVLHSKKAIAILADQDLRKEVYLVAFTQFTEAIRTKNYRKESNLKTFFNAIFFNRCKDKLEEIKTNKYRLNKPDRVEAGEVLQQLSDDSQDILRQLESKNQLDYIFKLLQKISPICAKLIKLYAIGYKYAEIALELNMTAASAKTTRRRCILKLLAQLNNQS